MGSMRRRRRGAVQSDVDAPGVVNPPPAVAISNYPSLVTVVAVCVATVVLLVFAGKFDPTRGPLTISIMIVLGMLATTAYVLVFTVPQDEITPEVVGALGAAFGGVVVYWLGRHGSGYNPPVQPPEPPKGPPDGHP
jgi:hypothetical protein